MIHMNFIEALSMLQLLLSQSPDIQKILAFEGAFEKLFTIVSQEGGLDGGVVVRDALSCVDTLLRFNSSNQVRSYCAKWCLTTLDTCTRVISAKHRFRLCSRPFWGSRLRYRQTSLPRKNFHCNFGMLHINGKTRRQ